MVPHAHSYTRLEDAITLAVAALEAQGLKIPPAPTLVKIILFAQACVSLLRVVSINTPSQSELTEFFQDLVIRAVNRAGGLWDATSN